MQHRSPRILQKAPPGAPMIFADVTHPLQRSGDGAPFHRVLARCKRFADDTDEGAFAPHGIMHEQFGQTHALTPACKTPWPPVDERLLG